MNPARFGVRLPVAGVFASPSAITDVAQLAEELAFDSVWVHDYIIWNKLLDQLHISCGSREAVDAAGEDSPPIFDESLETLAFVAGATESIRLGVAVLCLPYRSPIVTAKQIATLDMLSGGRLELGIGPGAAKRTHNVDPEVLGVDRAVKFRQTREYFEAMRAIWIEDAATFDGHFISYEGAEVFPKPAQSPYPPVWIGGSSEKSLQMVAAYATGWLPNWITPDIYPIAIEDLGRRLEANGRDPGEMTFGTEIQVLVADTDEEAVRLAERTMAVFKDGYVAEGGAFAEHRDPDRSATMWKSSMIGSVQTVAETVQRYVDSGCTFFELKFIYHSLDHVREQLSAFSEQVMSAFAPASR